MKIVPTPLARLGSLCVALGFGLFPFSVGGAEAEANQVRDLLARIASEAVPVSIAPAKVPAERPPTPTELLSKLLTRAAVRKDARAPEVQSDLDRAWPKLAAALQSKEFPVSDPAAKVMVHFPERLVPLVPVLLEDPGASKPHIKIPSIRAYHTKARLLNYAVPKASPPLLLPHLAAPEEVVRLYAAWAVRNVVMPPRATPGTEEIVKRLTALLGDSSEPVRSQAARSLASYGVFATSAQPALVTMVRAATQPRPAPPKPQENPKKAVESLPHIGKEPTDPPPERMYRYLEPGPSIPSLDFRNSPIQDDTDYPRGELTLRHPLQQGLFALASIGAADALLEFLQDERPEVRLGGVQALRIVRGERSQSEELLLKLVKDPDALVRQAALRALADRPPLPTALNSIVAAASDADPAVIAAALTTLGAMARKDDTGTVRAACQPRLIPFLRHRDRAIVFAAVGSLERTLAADQFAAILRRELRRDPVAPHADRLLSELLPQGDDEESVSEERHGRRDCAGRSVLLPRRI